MLNFTILGNDWIKQWKSCVIAGIFLAAAAVAAGIYGQGDVEFFVEAFFYGALPVIFLIYEAHVIYSILVRKNSNGEMAYLLAQPIQRSEILFTQIYYILCSILVLHGIATVAGIGVSEFFFKGNLEIPQFLLLSLGSFVLQVCLSGIFFFFGCIFRRFFPWLLLCGGLGMVFLGLGQLSYRMDSLEFLKYATLYSLYDAAWILEGSAHILWSLPLLLVVGLLLYWLGMRIYQRRDLYL